MEEVKKRPVFIDRNGTFELEDADLCNNLYFPLAGEGGLKSCVTPLLGGDSKLDQNHFLYEPVSIENLSGNRLTRNFWCVLDGEVWSANGNSPRQSAERLTDEKESCTVQAGFMWHKVTRESARLGIRSEITSFVPYDMNVEIHAVTLTNTGRESRKLTFVPAIPIYGRSADNIRDHRHVTSLLGRVKVTEQGVIDYPTFSFDERGHQLADAVYFAESYGADGAKPVEFYPVLDEFVGRGTPDLPETAVRLARGERPEGFRTGETVNGQEIVGAMSFEEVTLEPGSSETYLVYAGIAASEEDKERICHRIDSVEKVRESLEHTKNYWISKVNIKITTGDHDFDNYMRWVAFQPELRRIYGCSFLPHHDYGKGGRGWRDLWQDCLALLLMDPSGVKQMLLGNYGGVRIDGTNATIIGTKPGEFKADRNSITRVWMDHGVWPFMTTKLYMDQTGDTEILLEEIPYFCDRQIHRGQRITEEPAEEGNRLLDETGNLYTGTVLEHILVQNLTAFWEVGEHNMIRLRDADWNDALDMAGKRGESVAFTAAYAGNLKDLADILESGRLGQSRVLISENMGILLKEDETLYEDPAAKTLLLEGYMEKVSGSVSGGKIGLDVKELAGNLRRKAEWLGERIRRQEWSEVSETEGWFNGYYDNSGRALDDSMPGKKNMMLTGQVFTVMSGVATEEQTQMICSGADRLLYDPKAGGYRLNTDFGEVKTDMGRMFGFAYGEKENGAVFSHMAVMYGNALYKRGFAPEGYKALKTLYDASSNFDRAGIYPGIPEYFGRGGRGLYSYLTGAASWYLLTVVLQMFGIRGEYGNLVISPALLNEQFDEAGNCSMELEFDSKLLKVELKNPKHLDPGEYRTESARIDGRTSGVEIRDGKLVIGKSFMDLLDPNVRHQIEVILG